MSNQDSHQVKVGQPADPPLKGRHSFVPPKVTPTPKAPPRPAPSSSPPNKGN